MAKFKIQFLVLHSNTTNSSLHYLAQTISEFNNFYASDANDPYAFSLNQKNTFCYTYNEKLSLHKNAQKDFTFSMDRYIFRDDRREENPFVHNLSVGSQLLLTDKNSNQYLFSISKISYDFKENNLIFNYTCQDTFTFQLTRQNSGYSIENNPEDEDYLGAHNVDWWVKNKIHPECHIAYKYLSLAEGLYQKDNNVVTTEINSGINETIKIIKFPLQIKEYVNDYFNTTFTGYYSTIPFSASGTADSVLISLGEEVGLILNTREYFNESTGEMQCYYWFEPEKSDKISGLKYSPYSDIQNFGLSHDGTSLSTVLNVEPTTIGEELITLFPSMPTFFQQWILSTDWDNTRYGVDLFSTIVNGQDHIMDSLEDTNYNQNISKTFNSDLYTNYLNDQYFSGTASISGVSFTGLFIPIYFTNRQSDTPHYCELPKLFDRISFNGILKSSNINLMISGDSQIWTNYDHIWKILLLARTNNRTIEHYIELNEGNQIPSNFFNYNAQDDDVELACFVFIATSNDCTITNYHIDVHSYRNFTQEEKEWATVADQCPWLENKLIDFNYFYNHNILNKKELSILENLIFNDLRIVNGRFLIYSQQYYAAIHEKTKLIADLTNKLDNIGAAFESDFVSPFNNSGEVADTSRFNDFQQAYNLLFNTAQTSIQKPLLGLNNTLADYLNKYISTEQRFLRNIYEFRKYFDEKVSFINEGQELYNYIFTLAPDVNKPNYSVAFGDVTYTNSGLELLNFTFTNYNKLTGETQASLYKKINNDTYNAINDLYTKDKFDSALKQNILYEWSNDQKQLSPGGAFSQNKRYYEPYFLWGYNGQNDLFNDLEKKNINNIHIVSDYYQDENSEQLTPWEDVWEIQLSEDKQYFVFKNKLHIFNDKFIECITNNSNGTYHFSIGNTIYTDVNIADLILCFQPIELSQMWSNYWGRNWLKLKNSDYMEDGGVDEIFNSLYLKDTPYASINSLPSDMSQLLINPGILSYLNEAKNDWDIAEIVKNALLPSTAIPGDWAILVAQGLINAANKAKIWNIYRTYCSLNTYYKWTDENDNIYYTSLEFVNKTNSLSFYRRVSGSKVWNKIVNANALDAVAFPISRAITKFIQNSWTWKTDKRFDTDGYSYLDIWDKYRISANGIVDYDPANIYLTYTTTATAVKDMTDEDGYKYIGFTYNNYLNWDDIVNHSSSYENYEPVIDATKWPAESNLYYRTKYWRFVQAGDKIHWDKPYYFATISKKMIGSATIYSPILPFYEQQGDSNHYIWRNIFDIFDPSSEDSVQQKGIEYISGFHRIDQSLYYPLSNNIDSFDFTSLIQNSTNDPIDTNKITTWRQLFNATGNTWSHNSVPTSSGLYRFSMTISGTPIEFYILEEQDFNYNFVKNNNTFLNCASLQDIAEISYTTDMFTCPTDDRVFLRDQANFTAATFIDPEGNEGWIRADADFDLSKHYAEKLDSELQYREKYTIVNLMSQGDAYYQLGAQVKVSNIGPLTSYKIPIKIIKDTDGKKETIYNEEYDLINGDEPLDVDGYTITITKEESSESLDTVSNGTFWYRYKDSLDVPVLQNFAAMIESNLEQYWQQAYIASKYSRWFLPEHWQPNTGDTKNNFFTDICTVSEPDGGGQPIIKLATTFIPIVELPLVSYKYRFANYGSTDNFLSYVQTQQQKGWEQNDIISLSTICEQNEVIQEIMNYLDLPLVHWAGTKEYNNFTYYKVLTGGCLWKDAPNKLMTNNTQFPLFGGWYEMALRALLNSGYVEQQLPLYEKALKDHNDVWNKIYTLYPGVLLEQTYKNDNVSSSIELLKMAQMAFEGYKSLETQYSITMIDLAHLHGYQGQEFRIGMPIEIDAEEYYDEFDDIKRSLQQYLYITDLSYTLRQDKDISITVNSIKYQDKVIKELIRLIR